VERHARSDDEGGRWQRAVAIHPILARPGYRFIPATVAGPETLLHLDDPSGPYLSSAAGGRGRSENVGGGREGAASILGG